MEQLGQRAGHCAARQANFSGVFHLFRDLGLALRVWRRILLQPLLAGVVEQGSTRLHCQGWHSLLARAWAGRVLGVAPADVDCTGSRRGCSVSVKCAVGWVQGKARGGCRLWRFQLLGRRKGYRKGPE